MEIKHLQKMLFFDRLQEWQAIKNRSRSCGRFESDNAISVLDLIPLLHLAHE